MKLFKKILCLTLVCLMATCCFTSCDWLPFFNDDEKPDDNHADDQNNNTDDATGDDSQEEENKWDVDSPRKSKTYEMLFIGNSYTANGGGVHKKLKEMAATTGYNVNLDYVIKGAHNLEAFANPKDEYGKQVETKLAVGMYDYVVIQEQSHRPITDPESFYKGVRELVAKIRDNGATPILYCTWGRDNASSDIEKFGLISNEAMTYNLAAAYTAIAEELDVEVVYVGFAFYDIYNNTDINIYAGDANSHQNTTGAFLSALTLFCDIFNVKAEEVTYTMDLSEDVLAKLKAAANAAAFDPPAIPEEYHTTPTPAN